MSFDKVKKGLDDIGSAINLVDQEILALIKNIDKLGKEFDKNQQVKQLTENLKSLQKVKKESDTLTKQQIDLLKKEEQLRKSAAIAAKAEQAAIDAKNKVSANEKLLNDKVSKSQEQLTREKIKTANATKKQAERSAKLTSAYAKESKRLTELRNNAKNVALTHGLMSKEFKKAQKEVLDLNSKLVKIDTSLGQSQRLVGQYERGIGKLAGGFKGLIGALGFVGGLQLFANVLGDGFKKMRQYNKLQKTLEKQFKLTTKASQESAREILILSENYDKSTDEILGAANALAKEFDISISKSLDLINDGFEKGADVSGDFIEQLKEYPTQLKTVGLSADQTIALITQSVNEGVFSDKGVDAIKEAGLRLRELPKATKEALDGIGLSSKEIEKSLTDGSKSIFDVIKEVSTQLSKLPPQSSKVGKAIADIFGGPGEDAGLRYLTTLKDIDLNLDNLESTLDDTKKAQNELNEAWVNFIANLNDSSTGIGKFSASLTRFAANAITQFANLDLMFKNVFGSLSDLSEADLERFIKIGVIEEGAREGEKLADVLVELTKNYNLLPEAVRENLTLNQFLFESFIKLNASVEDARVIADYYTKSLEEQAKAEEEASKQKEDNNDSKKEDVKVTTDLIKIQEELLKQAKDLSGNTEADIAFRNTRIRLIEEEISRLKALGEETKKINIDFGSDEEALKDAEENADKQFENFAEQQERKLEEARAYEDKLTEITEQAEEQRAEIRAQAIEFSKELVNGLFENNIQKLQEETEQIISNYDERLSNELLSEEQRSLIEAERDRKVNENRKKEKELQKKQFLFNQGVRLAEIAVNTATAVTAQLATTPLPLGAPLVAGIIALGALQAATVAAQTIPQFDEGTDSLPSGLKWVAEKRPELVEHNGKLQFFDQPTILGNMYTGDKVIGGAETADLLGGRRLDIDSSNVVDPQMLLVNKQILSKLDGIEKAARKKNKINIYNTREISSYVSRGNSLLDNKFKGN